MPRNRVGSIRKVGNRWTIEVKRGSAEDGTLVRAYDSIPADRPREDAEALAVAMARRLGLPVRDEHDMTLGTFWRTVFPSLPSNRGTPRSNATMAFYERAMRTPLELLGDIPMRRLRHTDIARSVQLSGSPKNTKTALRAVLRAAYDNDMLDEMPFQRRVPTHRKRRKKPPAWSRFEVMAFFRAAESVPLHPDENRDEMMAFAVLGMCGLSKSEALGVRPMDIRAQRTYSFATGEEVETVTVTVAKTYTDEDGWKDWAKNDNRQRVVPVPLVLRPKLMSAIRALASTRGRGWQEQRIVQLTSDATVGVWKRLCARLGVRYIPPGMLRHTTDTIALAAGVQPDLNDKMHGRIEHSSTYANYFLPDLGMMEDASRKVSDMLMPSDAVEQTFPSYGDTLGIGNLPAD